jgi:hypothetical protein
VRWNYRVVAIKVSYCRHRVIALSSSHHGTVIFSHCRQCVIALSPSHSHWRHRTVVLSSSHYLTVALSPSGLNYVLHDRIWENSFTFINRFHSYSLFTFFFVLSYLFVYWRRLNKIINQNKVQMKMMLFWN